MIYKYRVRGPYSTAIAKIILSSGYQLVDLSEQLAQRLSLPPRREETPHATIKVSNEDPNTLVIVGLGSAVEEIINVLTSRIPYVSYEYNKYGPYTSIMVKIKGAKNDQCIAEYGNTVFLIQSLRRCIEGETTVIHIVKPSTSSNRVAIAFPGVSILKDTLVLLGDGMGKVFFSEHIREQDRKATLLSLSSHVVRQGYSIRWRSSARSATLEKIAKDLEEALNEIERAKSGKYDIGDIITEGEAIAFINLSRPSKEYLDDVRNTVIPTALGHHFMRTCAKLSGITELFDTISKYIDRDLLYKSLRYALADSSIGKTFKLIHRKPSGEKIEIGPIEVVDIVDNELGRVIVSRRSIRSGGVYNGLGVPKERGDIAITLVPIDTWFIVHRYIGLGGEEKGIYININTPPEVCPEERSISYLDLYIDVVYSDGQIQVVDREDLRDAIDRKILSIDFGTTVEKIVNYVKNNIDSIVSIARGVTTPR